jgi:hypothetical protein
MGSLPLALRIFCFLQYTSPQGYKDISPFRPGMKSELGSLEGPGNALATNSSFPDKSPSGIIANGAAEVAQRQAARPSHAHLNALLRTRRAPSVFRVLNHALVTAPFECRRYRYMSAILVRAIGNKAGPVRSAMANRIEASWLRIGASHCLPSIFSHHQLAFDIASCCCMRSA